MFENMPPPYKNGRTERELDFVFKLQKAILLGTPFPPSVPITTGLAAEYATKDYKSKFPTIWEGTGEEIEIEPKRSLLKPLIVSHGVKSSRDSSVLLTMAQARKDNMSE
jgi:hypothetical protein